MITPTSTPPETPSQNAIITREQLERCTAARGPSFDGLLAGLSPDLTFRMLRDAGVLSVRESGTMIEPLFERLVLSPAGEYAAEFTTWSYHGRVRPLPRRVSVEK